MTLPTLSWSCARSTSWRIAPNTNRRAASYGGPFAIPVMLQGQRIRKRIEEGFGWMKIIAGPRKTKYRGLEKVRWALTLAAAADPATKADGVA